MTIKNYLYCDQLAKQIQMILDRELPPECAKNISAGDFSLLPPPAHLSGYLPAVLIDNTDVRIQDVNAVWDIVKMEHRFDIHYLYPYDFRTSQHVPAVAKTNLALVANVLFGYRGLAGFEIPSSDTQAGGYIEDTRVEAVRFDCAETKLFRVIEVPMAVSTIEYSVHFRTFQRQRPKGAGAERSVI